MATTLPSTFRSPRHEPTSRRRDEMTMRPRTSPRPVPDPSAPRALWRALEEPDQGAVQRLKQQLFPAGRQSVRRLASLRRPSCGFSGPSRRGNCAGPSRSAAPHCDAPLPAPPGPPPPPPSTPSPGAYTAPRRSSRSGKEVALPPPPPLRTVRETFHFIQLKPSRTPLAGRGLLPSVILCDVDLPVAVGVQQLQVVARVRDRLGCARSDGGCARSVLCDPQGLPAHHDTSLLAPSIGTRSGSRPASVWPSSRPTVLPGTVPTPDRTGWRRSGSSRTEGSSPRLLPSTGSASPWPLLVADRPGEDPVAVPVALEVFLLDPLPALLRVPSPAPPPQHPEDPVSTCAKVRLLAA